MEPSLTVQFDHATFAHATSVPATFVHATPIRATFFYTTFVQGQIWLFTIATPPVWTKQSNFKVATEPNQNLVNSS